jgi:hypothetical protein
MSFLRQIFERKLSAAMGAAVTFEEFKFSPLSGNVEVAGVKVAMPRFATPMLTIGRISAKLHVARALKQEIVLKSLSIERPVLSIVCRTDGTLNLSAPKRGSSSSSESGSEGGAWTLECDKVLIVGGAVTYRDDRREKYQLAVEGIDATLTPNGSDLSITLTANATGRRDRPVELGPLKLLGKLAGVSGWKLAAAAGLQLAGTLDDALELKLASSSRLAAGNYEVDLDGPLRLASVLNLLPTTAARAIPYSLNGGPGEVKLKLRATIENPRSVIVREFAVSTGQITLTRPTRPKP